MNLTDEQRAAVVNPGHSFIAACPGSGKTRTIIAKLLRCVDELRGTPRRVACITYTNAAVDEIEKRLRELGSSDDVDYCLVATIHSFCLETVLRPFAWRLPEYKNGFEVLSSDSDEYRAHAEAICDQYRLPKGTASEFELLIRKPDGSSQYHKKIPGQAASSFWKRLEADGYIDFPSILFQSYRLMKAPTITNGIAARFEWVLVDEFQDTTEIQVGMLQLIAERKQTTFFIVGDELQSIFGFAGAKPVLMSKFAATLSVEKSFPLSANFRSSSRIVAHAERLIPRKPPMQAFGPHADLIWEPMHISSTSAFDCIADNFLPALAASKIPYGESAILASSWYRLFSLARELRNYGTPIIGPGARPYNKHHLFALLAEVICAYVAQPEHYLIAQAEREIFKLALNLTGVTRHDVFSFFGRRVVFALVSTGLDLKKQFDGASDWLRAASTSFGSILESEEILPRGATCLLEESVESMLSQMNRNDIDLANFRVDDLGFFARHEDSIRLLTIHKSKGLEFDAVAIVDLHEDRLPYRSSNNPDEEAAERRKLYVAITRAKRLLMYFTDSEHSLKPSRFLDQLGMSRDA